MSIYNKSGTELFEAYQTDGDAIQTAYDVNGSIVFPSPGLLKVMSYNVQKWEGDNALKSIQNVAFSDDADIIGIQEWGYAASKTIEGTNCTTYLNDFGYDTVTITTGDVNHKALASKYDLTNYSETTFATSHETRSYTKAYITFNDVQIAWFNTHLDWEEDEYKYNQVQELLTAVAQEDYFILTGDLNTTCTDKSDAEYVYCVQPFINAGYNVANSPVGADLIWTYYNGKTVETSTQITPPDNIITSANIDIVDVYTIDTKLSANTNNVIDHIPLVAYLRLSETQE